MDKNRVAVDVFDKLARQYRDKFMDVSLYKDSLDLFCGSLPAKAAVLELACGPGNITKHLLDRRGDINILATDLSPNMLALAKESNPQLETRLMDARRMGDLQKQFDGIMCGFCLPYLSKEEAVRLIAVAAKRLNKGGVFYLSTMEGDYSKSGFETSSSGDKVFMHYHEEKYLREALDRSGFNILLTERKNYVSNAKDTTDLILLAALPA